VAVSAEAVMLAEVEEEATTITADKEEANSVNINEVGKGAEVVEEEEVVVVATEVELMVVEVIIIIIIISRWMMLVEGTARAGSRRCMKMFRRLSPRVRLIHRIRGSILGYSRRISSLVVEVVVGINRIIKAVVEGMWLEVIIEGDYTFVGPSV
jgi:hypothetical protein